MKDTIKSSIITFAAGFAIAVVPHLDSLTMESLKNGTLIGILFAAVRTGLKMVFEAFLTWYASRK